MSSAPPEPSGPSSPERRVDVVVVGAGPAGTATAIALARAGRSVLVADRATFPRDKICGDGLTTAALRELEDLGLDPARVASWTPVAEAVVRSPSGRETVFPFPSDGTLHAVVARRRDLDAALVELARDAGATVAEATPLLAARDGRDAVVVELGGGVGPVRAGTVVGADGMWSPLRRALGLAEPGYRGEWHAFRQYLTAVSPRAARELVVWFEPDLLPGYAWSFPVVGGSANVGFGILRGAGYEVGAMAAVWRELLARPHIRSFLGPDARPEGPHRAWPIPAHVERATLAEGRALFVGDAATAADPMTGEGIGQALATGRWAAEAVLAGGDDPAAVADAYRRSVRTGLARDNRFAAALGGVLRTPLGARAAVRVAGTSDWTRRNFARWLFEDYPRALVLTPDRWHRGALHGDGAYRGRPCAPA